MLILTKTRIISYLLLIVICLLSYPLALSPLIYALSLPPHIANNLELAGLYFIFAQMIIPFPIVGFSVGVFYFLQKLFKQKPLDITVILVISSTIILPCTMAYPVYSIFLKANSDIEIAKFPVQITLSQEKFVKVNNVVGEDSVNPGISPNLYDYNFKLTLNNTSSKVIPGTTYQISLIYQDSTGKTDSLYYIKENQSYFAPVLNPGDNQINGHIPVFFHDNIQPDFSLHPVQVQVYITLNSNSRKTINLSSQLPNWPQIYKEQQAFYTLVKQ